MGRLTLVLPLLAGCGAPEPVLFEDLPRLLAEPSALLIEPGERVEIRIENVGGVSARIDRLTTQGDSGSVVDTSMRRLPVDLAHGEALPVVAYGPGETTTLILDGTQTSVLSENGEVLSVDVRLPVLHIPPTVDELPAATRVRAVFRNRWLWDGDVGVLVVAVRAPEPLTCFPDHDHDDAVQLPEAGWMTYTRDVRRGDLGVELADPFAWREVCVRESGEETGSVDTVVWRSADLLPAD